MNLSAGEQAWLVAHPLIRVGMDPDYAPYEWADQDGRHVGMAVDYLRRLEQILGVRFEIVKDKSWAEAIGMARRGEVDMLSSTVMTPERSRFLTFTEPYREIQTVIIDSGQGGFIGSLDQLAGRRVAVEQGYYTEELLARDYPRIRLLIAANTQQALRLLADGQADAYVGDLGVANYAIKKLGLSVLRFSGQTEYRAQHRFAVTRTQAELASILDKAWATIPAQEADAIANRWLGLRIEQAVPAGTLLKYGAAAALSLLLFGYWVYRLRRQVGERKAAEVREQSRGNVLEMVAQGTPLPEVLDAIVCSVEQENANLHCGIGWFAGQDGNSGQFVAPGLLALSRTAGVAMATPAPLMTCEDIAARAGLDSCWTQAMYASQGHQIGTFSVYYRKAQAPAQAGLILIQQFVRLAGIAIEKSLTEQKQRESEALYRLLIEDASDVIWKADRDLHMTYISPVDERLRGYRAGEVIGHHVFEMFTEAGIATVNKLLSQKTRPEQGGAKSGFVTFEAQHRCKDGRLLWAEVLCRPELDAHGALVGYHGITREITERKQMQDQVRQLAFYDPLTKLPNRRLLSDRLLQALAANRRSACHGAVMMLDLDNFKSLNDTHGHLSGDLLLVEAAGRLAGCVREIDTVARFGGDEFVVMLSALNADSGESTLQAGVIAEKIRASLSAPYRLKARHDAGAAATIEHHCSASIGVVVFGGNEVSQDDVLKWADAAMYQAKYAGRNLIRFHVAPAGVDAHAGSARASSEI